MAQPETETKSRTRKSAKTDSTSDPRIPFTDSIFANIAAAILKARDEISEYNAVVLAPKSEDEDKWTIRRLVSEAKSWARPEDGSTAADSEADTLLRQLENLQDEVNKARSQLASYAANKLGVDMTQDRPERDSDREEVLKVARSRAVAAAKMMQQTAEFSTDAAVKDQILAFLADNDIPQIGREGSLNITAESVGTPKYRVDVKAEKDGTTVLDEKGFTKAALAAKKLHAKNEAPTRDDFAKAWENAGNKAGETAQATVSFEHQGVTYILTAR